MTAVIAAEHFGISERVSDIALGAYAGIIGCIVSCVLSAAFCMKYLKDEVF